MVEVNNLTSFSVEENFLKKIAKVVLEGEKIEEEVDLSIALVSSRELKRINKRYRGKDEETDVLSFSSPKEFKTEGVRELGEIIINPEYIREKDNFKKEIALLLIHGILHLLGYEHEGPNWRTMIEKQNYYLLKLT